MATIPHVYFGHRQDAHTLYQPQIPSIYRLLLLQYYHQTATMNHHTIINHYCWFTVTVTGLYPYYQQSTFCVRSQPLLLVVHPYKPSSTIIVGEPNPHQCWGAVALLVN